MNPTSKRSKPVNRARKRRPVSTSDPSAVVRTVREFGTWPLPRLALLAIIAWSLSLFGIAVVLRT